MPPTCMAISIRARWLTSSVMSGLHGRLEALGFDPQCHTADGNTRERVDTVFVGRGRPFGAAIHILGHDFRADNGPLPMDPSRARDAGADFLGVSRPGAETHERQNPQA